MSETGYRGISFPFRVGITGGVTMSSTNSSDISHIQESIRQVMLTFLGERAMNPNFGSELNTIVFEPQDQSGRSLMSFLAQEALNSLDDRIKVKSVNIYSENNVMMAEVVFSVLMYEGQVFTEKVKVGDGDNG